MDLKQRMKLYEASHQKEKLVLNESIFEDDIPEEDPIIAPTVEEESHEAPEVVTTPEENGIQNMVQFLIKDEWDAIEGYNNTIQTLKDIGGYDDLCGVLQEISNEELVHVGQLQKALEFVNPVTAKIKDKNVTLVKYPLDIVAEGQMKSNSKSKTMSPLIMYLLRNGYRLNGIPFKVVYNIQRFINVVKIKFKKLYK